jgi:multicomponent Na+:H+ antiporter subunit C
MTLFLSLVVGVLFAVSVYLMLGRELKEVAMGFFLLSHAANLAIIEAGRFVGRHFPPVLGQGHPPEELVDPLPQALILTAIVIGFAVQGFLLTLLVVTWRRSATLALDELSVETPADEGARILGMPGAASELPDQRAAADRR